MAVSLAMPAPGCSDHVVLHPTDLPAQRILGLPRTRSRRAARSSRCTSACAAVWAGRQAPPSPSGTRCRGNGRYRCSPRGRRRHSWQLNHHPRFRPMTSRAPPRASLALSAAFHADITGHWRTRTAPGLDVHSQAIWSYSDTPSSKQLQKRTVDLGHVQ
jgi:hypothetical protein